MKNKRTIMTGNKFFFWKSSVQTSKLLICRISTLNSFSRVFLFCPTSESYWITTFHKDTLCRYIPGKNGDWKTSDLTKTTASSEQQNEWCFYRIFLPSCFYRKAYIKRTECQCSNVHILWFWNRRSVQDLLDEFPLKGGFLFPSPALVNVPSFH